MTINFFEPDDVPKPRDEVQIELLKAEVYPDRQRVKLEIHVTPFQERPSLEVVLYPEDNPEQPAATLSIVETMHPRMEFTLHLRTPGDPAGTYTLRAILFFRTVEDTETETLPSVDTQDKKEITVQVPGRDT